MEQKKVILCPTDLSENSRQVVGYAQNIAINLSADLLLFHASSIPVTSEESGVISKAETKYLKKEHTARKQLVELTNDLKANPVNKGKNVNYDFLWEDGLPVDAIKNILKEKKIDLLVMGTHGTKRDKFQGIFLESNASAILEEVSCPVIFLPFEESFKPLSEVIYAFDAFHYNMNTIVNALDLLKSFKPNVTFLHITEEKDSKVEAKFAKAKSHILENITYENVNFKLFTASDILHGLNEYAEVFRSDLIVMSTYRRNLIEKIFDASLSKKMVYQLKVPVLVMQAPKR